MVLQFDPVLPLDKFTKGIEKMRELADKEGLELIIYGHAGDGNLHPSFIVSNTLKDKMKARYVIREFDAWIENEGGCYSGEYAVGFFLGRSQDELRPEVSGYLKNIQKTFDPDAILNPGKIVDIREGSMDIAPFKKEYKEIGGLVSLCVKCHLCKNDSPLYAEEPFEHNTIRGRVGMVDAAARGAVSFKAIKPFVEEMSRWVKDMNCPAYIKDEMDKIIKLSLSKVQ